MISLKLILDVLFILLISFLIFKFVQALLKIRQGVSFPITAHELSDLRTHPQKPLNFPTYADQKAGIIFYCLLLLFIVTMFLLGVLFQPFSGAVYLILIIQVLSANNLLNLFAVVEDGIVSGDRFIAWNNIKSFQFIPIDINHKYYGFSKEANGGYELKIKTKGFPVSCVVTSTEMKDRLEQILRVNVNETEVKSYLKEC